MNFNPICRCTDKQQPKKSMSGSSQIQILMIFIATKVGVTNTHWVIHVYTLVSTSIDEEK